ncbi:hypothetical protein [Streptomyces sp. HNM0574]|uniref:hypothetical protein n=1 Tax=Streptomyces sp. HNM0574 TaxID=2714954 RepID=UPI00146D4889|nr:hypothetical protein [Streptomyces sp. HNM0574]NLU68282.1 hypothetical protein [Streptomyces sp. HNM0574]
MTLRIAYVVAGLAIGGAWAYGRDMPLWEHALRLCVIVVVVPPVLHLVRRRLRRPAARHLPLRQLVLAKVLLVLGAVAVELLLEPLTAGASLITAAALAAVVALGGPSWHRNRHGAAGPPRTP